MTIPQAMEHTFSQLKLMEQASARYEGSIAGSRWRSTMAAVAPLLSKEGKKIADDFLKSIDEMVN